MVRPDASDSEVPRWGAPAHRLARRVELAGVSPARVSAGAPGSRLPLSSEISPVKRSVESPTLAVWPARGEQACGPSIKRTLQPRDICPRKGEVGRAGHFAVKATDCVRSTGRTRDTPGVGRRARRHSSTRNWRDPRWLPTSGEGAAYKRIAKGRRTSRPCRQEFGEGFVVPLMSGESRTEGRDPALVTPMNEKRLGGMVY